jgi:hypothetical protein
MSDMKAAVEMPLPIATVVGVWQLSQQVVWCLNNVFTEHFSADVLGTVPHQHVKGPAVGLTQDYVASENAA